MKREATSRQREVAAAKITGSHPKDEAARRLILSGTADDHPLVQAEMFYRPAREPA